MKEVPLGHWKTDAGLQFCQSMLINGISFNSETWHSATEDDLNVLKRGDESLLRGILKSHSKKYL